MDSQKTFYLLTPAGRSAVATTRICSGELQEDLAKLFLTQSGRPVNLKLRKPQFGFWRYTSGNREGLVTCLLDQNTAEIHSHGGELAPQLIAQSLLAIGYSQSTQERNLHQDSNGHVWRSEVQLALSNAATRKTALALLELSNCVAEKLEELGKLITTDRSAAVACLQRALSFREFGLRLTSCWSIVICGQPNVGKSSLINTVSGFARAIVHDSPGTTRDVVAEVTAFQGWPVELKDTAGIRFTDEKIESEGVRRAREEFQKADLKIGMFDGSQPWSDGDQQLLDELNPDVIVHNKSDQRATEAKGSNRPEGVWISALTGEGVAELIDSLITQRVGQIPRSELFPINSAQVSRMESALQTLEKKNASDEVVLRALLGG